MFCISIIDHHLVISLQFKIDIARESRAISVFTCSDITRDRCPLYQIVNDTSKIDNGYQLFQPTFGYNGWNCPRYIGGSVQQMQFGHLCNDWGRFCDIDGPAWGKTVISPQLSTIHIFHTKLIMDINPSRTQHLETLNHLLLGMGTHNSQPYLFKSCFH